MTGTSSKRRATLLATGVGRALGATFYAVGKARSKGSNALHPRGAVSQAVLERRGGAATGVPWLDEAGSDTVLVRRSRSTGLPAPLPDILGLALRVPLDTDRYADLLLATTGRGPLTRFLLRPTRRTRSVYTCLLPYRAPRGPMLLAALPTSSEARFELAFSSLTGPWSPFGVLQMPSESNEGDDAPVSFDPVLHQIPQLENYAWVAQLRRFAYAGSRRARGVASP